MKNLSHKEKYYDVIKTLPHPKEWLTQKHKEKIMIFKTHPHPKKYSHTEILRHSAVKPPTHNINHKNRKGHKATPHPIVFAYFVIKSSTSCFTYAK